MQFNPSGIVISYSVLNILNFVRNAFWYPAYDPISGPSFRFSYSCTQTSCYHCLTSITPAIEKKNTWSYHISTIVWNWGAYPGTARILLHQRGAEAPQAVLTDGLGPSHWLTSQQHVSHGCGETHWWISVDNMRMEKWPSGMELHLWLPPGAGKQASSFLLPAVHPQLPACTSLQEHSESWENSGWPCILIQAGTTVRIVGL